MAENLFVEKLMAAMQSQEILITPEIAEKFNIYKEMLVDWNTRVNLTAITDDEGVIWKHFVDSAMLADVIEKKNGKLIDVGTGAGFPGIPLKILLSEINVTLLDSLEKRIKFLNEVCNNLRLDGIKSIHSRAEDGGHNPVLREKFDYATARAVAALPVLSEYCLPFVKVGGIFVAMKAGDIDQEIKQSKQALSKLGGEVIDVRQLNFQQYDMSRTLIIIKKFRQTPTYLPRKAGRPAKQPL